ncbi:cytochrome c3 family protein [Bdellovibrionota bacterium FG-1]
MLFWLIRYFGMSAVHAMAVKTKKASTPLFVSKYGRHSLAALLFFLVNTSVLVADPKTQLNVTLDSRSKATANVTCMTSKCHTSRLEGAYIHPPVKARNGCIICHEPGNPLKKVPAGHPAVSIRQPSDQNKLCVTCHDNLENLLISKNAHAVIEKEGCVGCHNPHSSNHPKLLKKSTVAETCTSCHDFVDITPSTLAGKHATFPKEKCLHCHNAHRPAQKSSVKNDPDGTCLGCHEKAIKSSEDGHMLPAMAPWKDGSMIRHGSTANSHAPPRPAPQCIGCHSLHESVERPFLKGHFTDQFYETFNEKNFALCFKCHDSKLATSANSADATGFRNGPRNLHWVHTNQNPARNRTCRVCHTVHFSANRFLIQSWSPYKGMKLPIHFEPTATGGSCATACHATMKYDRMHEVKNERRW